VFMYAIGKFFSQLYLNDCERMMLKKLHAPRTRKEVRLRAPFSIDHAELINIGYGTEFQKHSRINLYPERIGKHTGCETKLTIGNNCFFGNRVTFLVGASINVGDWVLVADDVSFFSENHGINPESNTPYMNQQLISAPVSIGNNCWIGDKATIMPGVSIGKGCIIGAMSVVTRDIPDYSIAVGCPAKVIKQYDFENHKWVRVKKMSL